MTRLGAAFESVGLVILGAFHPGPDDDIPPPAAASRAATIVLAGNGGGSMWPYFTASRGAGADALNDWSSEIFQALAARFGARAVLPQDGPPYAPFQRWARRGGQVHDSPIGILIHPTYGLWHSYRGALVFSRKLALPAPGEAPSPCGSCPDRPCLNECPARAFQPGRYDLERCVGEIDGREDHDCRMLGCGARRVCPVGREHIYPPAQAQFHMAAFMAKHGRKH
jgi:hypothetical protein